MCDVSCQCIQGFLQDTHVGLGFDLSLVLVAPFRTCKWTLMGGDSVQDVDKYFQMTTLNTSERQLYQMIDEEPIEPVEPDDESEDTAEPESPEDEW
jgi:hypothetical protein